MSVRASVARKAAAAAGLKHNDLVQVTGLLHHHPDFLESLWESTRQANSEREFRDAFNATIDGMIDHLSEEMEFAERVVEREEADQEFWEAERAKMPDRTPDRLRASPNGRVIR